MSRLRTGGPLITFLICGVVLFMTSLDALVVTNALPTMRIQLHTGVAGLEWTVNAYTLTFSVLLLPGAALGERFGRRRVFLIGLTVFTAASAAAALAGSINVLIAARVVQGAGGAIVVPLTLTLLAAAVSDARREIALAAWSGMGGLAIALGPVIGGAIVQGVSWHWIFWLNVPVGLAVLPTAARYLAESRGPNASLDVPGLALAVLAFGGIVFGLVHASTAGWSSPSVLVGLIGGALALVAFLTWERRASEAMVPLRLFRDRGFAASNAMALLLTSGMFGAVFLLAQFLQTVQGYSPLAAGLRTLPWTAAPVITAPLAGLLASKVGIRVLVSIGVACQGISLVWLALTVSPTVGYLTIVPALVLAGVGMGLFFALLAPMMLSFVAKYDEGVASGVNNAMRELGVVLGVALLTALFAAKGGYGSAHVFVNGLVPALWLGAALVAVAFVASLLVPKPQPQPHLPPASDAAEDAETAEDYEAAAIADSDARSG